jgi:hypothetical protein
MRTGAYERIAETLLRGQEKNRDYRARVGHVWEGKFLLGNKSLHRTPQSRRWRMFWQLKSQRQTTVGLYWRTKSQ